MTHSQSTVKRRNLIVVEGPDGAGKTTYINQVLSPTMGGIEPLHGGGPPMTSEEIWQRIGSIPSGDVILDRWAPVSEQIYGPIIRGHCLVTPKELVGVLVTWNPQIIYCRPPFSVIEKKLSIIGKDKEWKPEEHVEAVTESIKGIVDSYDRLMKSLIILGLNIVRYDYTGTFTK